MATENDNAVAFRGQVFGERPSEEAGAAGNYDLQNSALSVRRRCGAVWFPAPAASKGAPGDPFLHQRVHDDVSTTVTTDEIVADQRAEGVLNCGGASQAMALARVGR